MKPALKEANICILRSGKVVMPRIKALYFMYLTEAEGEVVNWAEVWEWIELVKATGLKQSRYILEFFWPNMFWSYILLNFRPIFDCRTCC